LLRSLSGGYISFGANSNNAATGGASSNQSTSSSQNVQHSSLAINTANTGTAAANLTKSPTTTSLLEIEKGLSYENKMLSFLSSLRVDLSQLSFWSPTNLLGYTRLEEPTFEKILVLYFNKGINQKKGSGATTSTQKSSSVLRVDNSSSGYHHQLSSEENLRGQNRQQEFQKRSSEQDHSQASSSTHPPTSTVLSEGRIGDEKVGVKMFTDVPMCYYQLLFPGQRINLRPLDRANYSAMLLFTSFSTLPIFAAFLWNGITFGYAAAATLSVQLMYWSRLALRYRATWMYQRQHSASLMQDHVIGSRNGAIRLLFDDAVDEMSKQILLSYYVVLDGQKEIRSEKVVVGLTLKEFLEHYDLCCKFHLGVDNFELTQSRFLLQSPTHNALEEEEEEQEEEKGSELTSSTDNQVKQQKEETIPSPLLWLLERGIAEKVYCEERQVSLYTVKEPEIAVEIMDKTMLKDLRLSS